jgi:putative DNA primase/helicase
MIDLSQYIGDIARRLLGSPNPEHSTREQLRFGTNGSIAVEIAGPDVGTWYNHEHKRGGGPMQLLSLEGGMLPVAAREWLKAELGIELEEPKPKSRQQVVSTYDYVDESGQLLSQAVRKGPVKRFHQRAPDGNGGWKVGPDGKWTIKGVRLVPYRLPELISAAPETDIYIVEGEKDVDNLRAIDCIGTCNPMGAGKWRTEFAEYFHGRNVVILPDNDETGRDHAIDVAANLAPVAACVRILELPGLPEKGDVSDWLAAGGTREQLEQLAAAAPAFDPNMVRPRTSKLYSDREPRDIRVFLGAPYEIAGIFLRERFTHERPKAS